MNINIKQRIQRMWMEDVKICISIYIEASTGEKMCSSPFFYFTVKDSTSWLRITNILNEKRKSSNRKCDYHSYDYNTTFTKTPSTVE